MGGRTSGPKSSFKLWEEDLIKDLYTVKGLTAIAISERLRRPVGSVRNLIYRRRWFKTTTKPDGPKRPKARLPNVVPGISLSRLMSGK